MQQEKATADQLSQFLLENLLWSIKENKLYREFIFCDFAMAFEFMTQAAKFFESLNHHPEWSNSYNKVTVNLITHESDGISNKDFRLAKKMSSIADHLT
jgi:4a-hydroxytetrahydrobiopterin dehydratase